MRDGLVTECNRAAEALLGVTSAEVVGRRLDDALWFTPAGADGPVTLAVPTEGVLTMEGSVDGPNGEAVDVVVRAGASCTIPTGPRAGSVLVIRDVRGEQEAERMKTEFLANISHELRTPLTPIKGYAGVLERRPVDQAQAAIFAREITAGVDQVERVIGRLVSFATVASGVLAVRLQPTPVGAVVEGAADRWRRRLGPTWTVDVQILDGETTVGVDRAYLDQAFDELVDNAVKHSPGTQRVTVGCALRPIEEGRRRRIRLAVADRGMGIDPERLEELTDRVRPGRPVGHPTVRGSRVGPGAGAAHRRGRTTAC